MNNEEEALLQPRLTTGGKKSSKNSFLLDALIIMFVVMLAFAVSVVLREYVFVSTDVKGTSMENTVFEGDVVYLVQTKNIKSGDVIRVLNPDKTDIDHPYLIKRVIGVGGDTVEIHYVYKATDTYERAHLSDPEYAGYIYIGSNENMKRVEGYVYLNGKQLDDAYIKKQGVTYYGGNTAKWEAETSSDTFIVPDGHIYFLGDNRQVSLDSRILGTTPYSEIKGKAIFLIRNSKIILL
ncbi:MAG: signal peptidase I [Clostridiales bacterium]|jgi:signal peptidase I|nr:signal peptidase I [Clostridiales bacterium]